jgi:hypothetical protein
MKTITILMDSLNRHRLSLYGGPVQVPNVERLASKGVCFKRHYAASLPCMISFRNHRRIIPLQDKKLEATWSGHLVRELMAVGAPEWQYGRLGLERKADA